MPYMVRSMYASARKASHRLRIISANPKKGLKAAGTDESTEPAAAPLSLTSI
jgi:hypothetical protein